jgi:hypothetical protein
MVRTKIRENQSWDEDYLSEQEGYETFIRRNITNDANIVLADGYKTYYLDQDGYEHSLNPLTISSGLNSFVDISHIEFDEGYSFTLQQTDVGKIKVGFTDLLATHAEVSDYSYWAADAYNALQADQTPQTTYTPIVEFGGVPQVTDFSYGYYVKNGVLVTLVANFYIAAKSSDPGIVTVSLPFISKNLSNFRQHLSVSGVNIGAYSGPSLYGYPVYGAETYGGATVQDGKPVEAVINPGTGELVFQRLGYTEDGILSTALPQTIRVNISGNYVIEP